MTPDLDAWQHFAREGQDPQIVGAVWRQLAPILLAGEAVQYIGVQHQVSPLSVVFTTMRLLLIGGPTFLAYAWHDLADIRIQDGASASTLLLQRPDGHQLAIGALTPAQSEHLHRLVRARAAVAHGSVSPAPPVPPAASLHPAWAPRAFLACLLLVLGLVPVGLWVVSTVLRPPITDPVVRPSSPTLDESSLAGLTPAEQAYVTTLTAQTSELQSLFLQLATNDQMAGQFSVAGQRRLSTILVGIQTVCAEAHQLTSPPSLSAVDTLYQSGIQHFTRAMELLTQWSAQHDDTLFSQADTEITLGDEDIHQAALALQAFKAAHP